MGTPSVIKEVCLVSLVDHSYMVGLQVMLRSFLMHNRWFEEDFILLDAGLSNDDRKKCRSIYSNVQFLKVDESRYIGKMPYERTQPRLKAAYFKFDLFRIRGYRRVVFLDSDIVVLRDIRELFELSDGFYAVKSGYYNKDQQFNSGVLCIDNKYLTDDNYNMLVEKAFEFGGWVADQDVINRLFADQITSLPVYLNMTKREARANNLAREQLAILHFVGKKPWESSDEASEKGYEYYESIWHDYNGVV